jgi:hypothetical protein
MMAKFQMKELIVTNPETARLGAGTGSANHVTDAEIGKACKFAGDSRYDLVAVTNAIEGFITAVESYTADDYSIGSVQTDGRKEVTFDGLQATPGTGTVAAGDYVVAGTVVAKGTALTVPVKVCKATSQTPGPFAWRVVSLGSAGTGAVGTVGIIERI